MDLSHLPNLHVFAISARIGSQELVVLRDIKVVLSTIPKANLVTKLSLDFTINYPYSRCLEEDWDGMCHEVVRISAGKPLEFNLRMTTSPSQILIRAKLYEAIKEKIAPLSNYTNISTDFWLRDMIS